MVKFTKRNTPYLDECMNSNGFLFLFFNLSFVKALVFFWIGAWLGSRRHQRGILPPNLRHLVGNLRGPTFARNFHVSPPPPPPKKKNNPGLKAPYLSSFFFFVVHNPLILWLAISLGKKTVGISPVMRSLLARWSHALDLFFQQMQLVRDARWLGGCGNPWVRPWAMLTFVEKPTVLVVCMQQFTWLVGWLVSW